MACPLVHNDDMERPSLQITVASMLGLVACIALNFWLFRLGVFWGIVGLNVTKHVVIANFAMCWESIAGDPGNPSGSFPHDRLIFPCPETGMVE